MIGLASTGQGPLVVLLLILLAAAGCAVLIVVLRPFLRIHALARPNARSSHREPTPQGGGAAVVASMLAVAWIGAGIWGMAFVDRNELYALTTATLLLAIVGAVDDIRGLSAVTRLVVQAAAAALVLSALPLDWRIIPALPWWIERPCLVVGMVWMVNLTNFMDGLDWMTVVEVVPMTAAIVLLGALGVVPPLAMLTALALFGAILGFAPFNRPVARLFLGDVGSLPIGFVLAWLLLELAQAG